jgi:hypothetical protein
MSRGGLETPVLLPQSPGSLNAGRSPRKRCPCDPAEGDLQEGREAFGACGISMANRSQSLKPVVVSGQKQRLYGYALFHGGGPAMDKSLSVY